MKNERKEEEELKNMLCQCVYESDTVLIFLTKCKSHYGGVYEVNHPIKGVYDKLQKN